MRLSFKKGKLYSGDTPIVIPIDAHTGERVDGVVEASVHSNLDGTTMTLTVMVSPESEKGGKDNG